MSQGIMKAARRDDTTPWFIKAWLRFWVACLFLQDIFRMLFM